MAGGRSDVARGGGARRSRDAGAAARNCGPTHAAEADVTTLPMGAKPHAPAIHLAQVSWLNVPAGCEPSSDDMAVQMTGMPPSAIDADAASG